MTRGSGLAVLAITSLVGVFLAYRGWQALRVAGFSFISTDRWQPQAGHGHFGIAAVLAGSVLIGLVAIFFALPLAIGSALYISEYAPRRLQRALVSLVDLMAAVPSVVYGLWGFFLQGHVYRLARWIATYFGWIPIFKVTGADPHDPLATSTVYTASRSSPAWWWR